MFFIFVFPQQQILQVTKDEILSSHPDAEISSPLGTILFIRFILASLTSPASFGVFSGISKDAAHEFKMITKLLQTTLTGKAGENVYTNCFIEEHFDEINTFLLEICADGEDVKLSSFGTVDVPDDIYQKSVRLIQYAYKGRDCQGESREED